MIKLATPAAAVSVGIGIFMTKFSFGEDDKIFNLIVDFDTCKFTEEDKIYLIKFLELLDKISDEKITIQFTEFDETIEVEDWVGLFNDEESYIDEILKGNYMVV